MYRIVTVTGDAITDPCNFRVRIGTNYHELIEEAGGFKQEPAKIISGGPMMGFGILIWMYRQRKPHLHFFA